MNRTAIVASPISDSQACDSSRPRRRQTAALRTGLGGQMLANLKTHPAQSRFPRQHGPEIRPTGIENTLCHVGLNEIQRAYIADRNERSTEPTRYPSPSIKGRGLSREFPVMTMRPHGRRCRIRSVPEKIAGSAFGAARLAHHCENGVDAATPRPAGEHKVARRGQVNECRLAASPLTSVIGSPNV
jgi:hypothetical protein